jgi:tRNA modification GTPase
LIYPRPEAVIDLIRAKTETGMQVAFGQLSGDLSAKIKEINLDILSLLAHLEALIDFPEEDLEDLAISEVEVRCQTILGQLEELIASSHRGKIYRDGVAAVIIGKPNVGKSSLLNALVRENRAIVTDIPGTTRDVIEEIVNIRGIPLKLIDTAGIRETDNLIERIGVNKTKEFVGRSDLVFFVLDAGAGIMEEDREIFPLLQGKKIIILVNKSDLNEDNVDYEYLSRELPQGRVLNISVLTGLGLESLEEELVRLVGEGIEKQEGRALVSNIRHQEALLKARDSIRAVLSTIQSQLPVDFLTIDLKSAWEYLGRLPVKV